jgi:hypothetical protein
MFQGWPPQSPCLRRPPWRPFSAFHKNPNVSGLASTKPLLKKTTLAAILNLAFRPLTYANNSDNVLSLFVLNILSVPALVYQVK